jgi:hypothetical protein
MLYLDQHVYYIISGFLGDIHTIKSLDRLCNNSRHLCKRISLLKDIFKLQGQDRFLASAANGFIDGVLYWETEDSNIPEALKLSCSNGHANIVKYLLKTYEQYKEYISRPYEIRRNFLGYSVSRMIYEPWIYEALTAPNHEVAEFLWPHVTIKDLFVEEISGDCILFLLNRGIKPSLQWRLKPPALVRLSLLNREAAQIFIELGYSIKHPEAFIKYCSTSLSLVKWFLALVKLDPQIITNGFIAACVYKNIEIASYLFHNYDLISSNEFFIGCLHLPISSFLETLFSQDKILQYYHEHKGEINIALYYSPAITNESIMWLNNYMQ